MVLNPALLLTFPQCRKSSLCQDVDEIGKKCFILRLKIFCFVPTVVTARSNSRWLSSSKHSPGSRRPLPSIAHTTLPLPTDAAIPERLELSEAECDIDTIKRLKLGLRSSLWARPSAHSSHSDYSIAV